MAGDDPFDLARFVTAQHHVYGQVVAELTRGRKETHWIWFIFPQLRGLGRSATAAHFGITSSAEAKAYLAHPQLGFRLLECVSLVLTHATTPISDIFAFPDDLKFQSSMTLFAEVAPDVPIFAQALDVFFGGNRDPATVDRLRQQTV